MGKLLFQSLLFFFFIRYTLVQSFRWFYLKKGVVGLAESHRISICVFIMFAIVLTVLFHPDVSSAEGDCLVRLEHKNTAAEIGAGETSAETIVKRTIIAESFLRANHKLRKEEAWEYASYVIESSKLFGLDPFLIASLIIKESTVKRNARSKYAYGLMQINWKVHKKGLRSAFNQIKSLKDLMEPRNNIMAGTYIFSWYMKSSNYNVKKALARYLGKNGKKYISKVLEEYNKMNNSYKLAKLKENKEMQKCSVVIES